jgi:adenosine deaminase
VTLLGADRIDHAVRAIEDAALVAMLAERKIPLGVCLTSNLVLGASLIGEYSLCRQAFGWTDDVTKEVARTSIEASFADENLKAKLLKALASW